MGFGWTDKHTVQHNLEDFIEFTCLRPYWKCYYANTDGIIFVVDSADIDRLMAAKAELNAMLNVNTQMLKILKQTNM